MNDELSASSSSDHNTSTCLQLLHKIRDRSPGKMRGRSCLLYRREKIFRSLYQVRVVCTPDDDSSYPRINTDTPLYSVARDGITGIILDSSLESSSILYLLYRYQRSHRASDRRKLSVSKIVRNSDRTTMYRVLNPPLAPN
jgi:hypothetical protein